VAAANSDILISIVIVNYKVPYCLMEALASLRLAELYDKSEVIVVDNASGDNSRELIAGSFPEVQWIQLKTNIGFGKACNVGVASAGGKYLLFLNPDTVVSSSTLKSAVEFMEANPNAGLMGPKILNPDGTLQLSCRRSNPTPLVAFYYFSGLSRLFPKSKRFGRYNLTYMDENETAQVDVVSGSFMFMKLELFRTIGGFDERFFMYGEDIDLCFRIRQLGYEVWYYPFVKIVHLKGKSSAKRQIRSRFYFYEAMIIFSRKYRKIQDSFFPRWLMWFGITFQAALNIGTTLVRSAAASLLDLGAINLSLWAGLKLWFSYRGYPSLYAVESLWPLLVMHGMLSLSFLFMFVYNGVYSIRHCSFKNIFFSGLLSSSLFMSGVYFLTPYSRGGFAAALMMAVFLTAGWRGVFAHLIKPLKSFIVAPQRVLVVGSEADVSRLIKNIDGKRDTQIAGVLRLNNESGVGEIEGYPVLGGAPQLDAALQSSKADALLIAAAQPFYSDIIDILVRSRSHGVEIQWLGGDRASNYRLPAAGN